MFVQSWTYKQLIKVREHQPEFVDQAIAGLLEDKPDLNWLVVVGAYLDEEINLGRAAALLGLHRLELQEKFKELGIPLGMGVETIDEAQAEVDAILAWNAKAKGNGENE